MDDPIILNKWYAHKGYDNRFIMFLGSIEYDNSSNLVTLELTEKQIKLEQFRKTNCEEKGFWTNSLEHINQDMINLLLFKSLFLDVEKPKEAYLQNSKFRIYIDIPKNMITDKDHYSLKSRRE